MDYEKAIRAVRSAASELSRFVEAIYDETERPLRWTSAMATTERDYYELLGVARGATRRRSRTRSAGSRASCTPTSPTRPTPRSASAEVVEAYEVLSKPETRELYDRYGHAGLRSGGFQPAHFDFGSLADLFSAFFGDDLLGGGAARGAARGATSPPRSRSSSSRRRAASTREVPFQVAVAVRALRRRRRRARHAVTHLPDAAAAPAGCSRSRAACSASSCAPRRARRCGGSGRDRRDPCTSADGDGRVVERADARGRRSRRASTTASASASAARATPGALGGRAGDVYVDVPSGPTRASSARATTSSRRSS